MFLNVAHSKRKIIGAFEHVLNPWLRAVLPRVNVLWDVGANDGYYTYGCAHVLKQTLGKGSVVAFEPGLTNIPELTIPSTWQQYDGIHFNFLPLFVGNTCNETTTTLEKAYRDRPHLHNQPGLIKVDVEGAELEVLAGAGPLLQAPHHWLVEVHGDHLLEPVLEYFREGDRTVQVHHLTTHPLLGPESRTIPTCWVTTSP